MKNYLLSVFILLIAGCGNQHSQQAIATQSIETEVADSTANHTIKENDIELSQDSTDDIILSLNDIRFKNWTQKEWYDNDYFRALRKYIDACYRGEIKEEVLEPYKFALKGKFAIFGAMPAYGGGMSIYFVFLDAPNKMFYAWIYSVVKDETVIDYQIRQIDICEKEPKFTKELILSVNKEHPEHKLW